MLALGDYTSRLRCNIGRFRFCDTNLKHGERSELGQPPLNGLFVYPTYSGRRYLCCGRIVGIGAPQRMAIQHREQSFTDFSSAVTLSTTTV